MNLIDNYTTSDFNSAIDLYAKNVRKGYLLLAFFSLDSHNNEISSSPSGWKKVINETTGHVTSEIWYKISDKDNEFNFDFSMKYSDQFTATLVVVDGVNQKSPIGKIKSNKNNIAPSIDVDNENLFFTYHTSHSSSRFEYPKNLIGISNTLNSNISSMLCYGERTYDGETNDRTAVGEAAKSIYDNISISLEVVKNSSNNSVEIDNNTVRYINSEISNEISLDTIILDIPNNTQLDDLMIAFISLDNDNNEVIEAPLGWILKSKAKGEEHVTSEIWYKIVTSDDLDSNFNFTLKYQEQHTASLITFRNIDTENPISNIDFSTTSSAPSIDISKDNNWLVTYHTLHASKIMNPAENMTKISSISNGNFASSIVAYEKRNTGLTGTRTVEGTLSYSLELNYSPPNVIPSIPNFIEPSEAKEKGTLIPLEWTKSTDSDDNTIVYDIEFRYDESEWSEYKLNVKSNANVFFVPHNSGHSTIQFRVLAKNTYGLKSNWSYSQNIRLLETTKLPIEINRFIYPEENARLNKGNSYKILWEKAINGGYDLIIYTLEIELNETGEFNVIASGFTDNFKHYLVPNDDNINSIRFRVKATSSNGIFSEYTVSDLFELNVITPNPGDFTAPNSSSLSRGNSYNIQWTKVENSERENISYELEYSYDMINYSRLISTTSNEFTWTVPSSGMFSNVQFRVRSRDTNGGHSEYVYSNTYSLNSKPTKPVWLSPLSDYVLRPNEKVTLHWLATDVDNDVLTYDVFISYNNSPLRLLFSNLTTSTVDYIVDNNYRDGNVYFEVVANDGKGLYSDSTKSPIFEAKSLSKLPTINLSSTTWTNKNVTVSIVDGESDNTIIIGSEYRLNDGVWQAYSKPFIISDNGQTKIEVRSLDDSLYSSGIAIAYCKIDKIPPNPPTLVLSNNNWTNRNVDISILENGDSTSGILRNEYKIGDNDWMSYNSNVVEIEDEGIIKVYARTIDLAGNYSDVVESEVKIDRTRPTSPTLVLSNNNWTSDNVSFTMILGSDELSGVHRYEYKIEDGEWLRYNGKQTISSDGITKVYARAVDLAGNYSHSDVAYVKIDRTAPSKPTILLSNTNWSNKAVNFTIEHGIDQFSKVSHSEFRIDSGNWVKYKEEYTIFKEGLTNIEARTIDNNGNISDISKVIVKIDRVPPTTPTIDLSDYNLTNSDVLVTINGGFDQHSGLERTEYKINDGNWITYDYIGVLIIESGNTKISARTVDNAGNVSDEVNEIVRIDKIGPLSPKMITNSSDWVKDFVLIELEPNEEERNEVEIESFEYKEDDGAWVTYEQQIIISKEGLTNVYARATDKLGNIGLESSIVVKVDRTPPESPEISVSNEDWTSDDVIVAITEKDDDLSGVKETQYKINIDGEWLKYEDEIIVSQEGSHSIFARTIDNVGNISKVAQKIVRVDKNTSITNNFFINNKVNVVNQMPALFDFEMIGIDYGAGIVERKFSSNSDFNGATWTILNNRVRTIIRKFEDNYPIEPNVNSNFNTWFDDNNTNIVTNLKLYHDNINWTKNSLDITFTKYSVEQIAYFTPKISGIYDFGIKSAGYCGFYINDTLLISNDTNNLNSDYLMQETTLEAGVEYRLVLKFANNIGIEEAGVTLGIKIPDINEMIIAPPELFFQSEVKTVVNDYLFESLQKKTLYGQFKDMLGNVSTISSDSIIKVDYYSSTIVSPVSNVGWILNQKPKIIVESHNLRGIPSDFRIQISNVDNFATLIVDDLFSSFNTGWTFNISGTKFYTPKIDLGTGTKYIRIADKFGNAWGSWSDVTTIKIKEPNWTDTINTNYTGVKSIWVKELKETLNAIKASRGLGYYQDFSYKTFERNDITVDNSASILTFRTGYTNPYIEMNSLGYFSPSRYRYFVIKYKVASGSETNKLNIYYYNDLVSNTENLEVNLTSDNEWHTIYVDAWENGKWKSNGLITGWKLVFDKNANYSIECISLVENANDIESKEIVEDISTVKLSHLIELRKSYKEVADLLGVNVTFTDPNITAGVTQRKGIHWLELRNLAGRL